MAIDQLMAFKMLQKESWRLFAPLEIFTTIPAANLINFSSVKRNSHMLDVCCGTGVVAITAAKRGANVSALDLCPILLNHAKENAFIAGVTIDFKEADVENIPYDDNSFDAVLSQFGHLFAPRPEVTIKEMLRVLKPGGIIAFSTWPPDLFVGRLLNLVEQFDPPPIDISSPSCWGDPNFVTEQLGNTIVDLVFDQGETYLPALSLEHYRRLIEATIGPVVELVEDLKNDESRLQQFRDQVEILASQYYADNYIHQHYLMTRATKKA